MKHILTFLFVLLLALPAKAQVITMEEGYASFDYPDDFLVVSPQLCTVYAPLLEEAGFDPAALAEEMRTQRVLSRAYSPDFSESFSVLTAEDDLSAQIYNIEEVTDSQRGTLRRRVENNKLWERTGLRAQDVEWQKENGRYYLYVHYTITKADEMVGRGLRYITVHNGLYLMLDWQNTGRRFTGRNLNAFRAMLSDLTFTQTLEQPIRSVLLKAEIPAETSVSAVEITGMTSPGAALVAEAPDGYGKMQTLSVGRADSSGKFALMVELEEEGTTPLTLTASLEDWQSTSVSGEIAYSAKTLPVSGIEEDMVVSTDVTELSGTTLAGVQIQLVTPFGLAKKRAGNDGSFSFELTTDEEGTYKYTLILDKKGYNQRRLPFTITREITDEQERERVRRSAVKLSYKTLQRDLPENRGAVMRLYGPVIDVSGSGSAQYVRMKYSKDGTGRWYNDVIIVAEQDMGAKPGDMLTAVVTVDGVYLEQDASGQDVGVPRFNLLFVDSVE